MSGYTEVAPTIWGTADFYVERIDNYDFFGISGSLRFEYWVFDTPYVGYPKFGYQLAAAEIGQLRAGWYLSNVSRTAPFTLPAYGFWYPTLVLSEYTLSGWQVRDWVGYGGRFMGIPPDLDADGWSDALDNCTLAWNPGQEDWDGDLYGDVCDGCPFDPGNDADGDGWCADADNCSLVWNRGQEDSDGDRSGDACDACPFAHGTDGDGDGWCPGADNCPWNWDPTLSDVDLDGTGDVCDACPFDAANDADGDGACSPIDNCPTAYNPGQQDEDRDGIGDICDASPQPGPVIGKPSRQCRADQLRAAAAICKAEMQCWSRHAASPTRDPAGTTLASCLSKAEVAFARSYGRAIDRATRAGFDCYSELPPYDVASALGIAIAGLAGEIEIGWDAVSKPDNRLRSALLGGTGTLCSGQITGGANHVVRPDQARLASTTSKARKAFESSSARSLAQATKAGVTYEGLAPGQVASRVEELTNVLLEESGP